MTPYNAASVTQRLLPGRGKLVLVSHLRVGDGNAGGTLEKLPEGEEDTGEAFNFDDSEEEEDRSRLVVSNARRELGTREALQEPPRRRRSSISDDLEPLDDWDAEEALLEGRELLTQSDSSANLGKAGMCVRYFETGFKLCTLGLFPSLFSP